MRKIPVATTKGTLTENVYEINELPLYEIMMHAPVTRRGKVYYLEIPAAFDIETTNVEPLTTYKPVEEDLYRYLLNLKIQYNDRIKSDIPDFESIRRKHIKMFSKSYGVPVDVIYEELKSLYPGIFPEDIINPSDQLLKIIQVTDANKPEYDHDLYRPYAFMYHWQFCIDHYVCFGRTWEEFKRLLNRLSSEMNLSENNRLVCYIHNANFEFTFMKHFINVTDSFFKDENKPLKFMVAEGIEFRDSYALSNMNLLKFCENSGAIHVKLSGDDYNYNKLRTPDTPLTFEEQAYCYNDVAGLCECIRTRMREDHLSTIPLTSTGYVRRIMRGAMRENRQNRYIFKSTALDEKLYVMHTEAFRGGDVHGNPAFADQTITGAGSFDIASAYPAELIINPHFPIGPWRRISSRRFRTARKADKCYILRLRIDTPRYIGLCGDPYISYSKITAFHDHTENALMSLDNGRLRSYDGIIEMTVLDVDYDIIRQEYTGSFFVSDVYEAQAGRLPEEFRTVVMDFYKKKTLLKSDQDDPEKYYYYCRAKEQLNACYGMCATKIDQGEISYDGLQHEFHDGTFDKESGTYIVKTLTEILDKYYKSRNNFLPYQWGCFCTVLVRAKLRRAMTEGSGRKTLYCDTDSVKFIYNEKTMEWFETENRRLTQQAIDAGAVAYDGKGKPHYLGVWEFEGYFEKFRHLGAKRYMYIKDGKTYVTIAGVNKKRAAEFFTKAGIEKFTDGTVIENSGHLVAYYNNDAPHYITVDGCTFLTASNVALINDTYTLGMEKDYKKLIRDLRKNIIVQEYI